MIRNWIVSEFIEYVCGSRSDTKILMGAPGGVPLYSLSVA